LGVDCGREGGAMIAIRERLPDRREAETFDFEAGGIRYCATVGRYPDGRIGELFINTVSKPGSAVTVFGADHPLRRMRLRLGRYDPAYLLKHFAGEFAVSASFPVLHSTQLFPRIATLFKPRPADGKNLLAIVEQYQW
jgi:hypothetical protein